MVFSPALAQEVQRVAVLTFDATEAAAPYRLSLATGLQRSLNVLDGVYAPPVGDTLLVAQSYNEREALNTEVFAEAYDAGALVSGLVGVSGETVSVDLIFAGPGYEETKRVPVEGPREDPAELLQTVVDAVVAELGLSVSEEDRAQLRAVAAQAPSFESLRAVGEASLDLDDVDTPALQEAAERDGDSSWVLSERAEALLASGDEEAALGLSLRAIQAAPEDIEALVGRGAVLVAAGDLETARQAFDVALELNPSHPVALAGSAQLAEGAEVARSRLEAAIAAYPRYAAAYLELATLQRRAGSPQTALQTLRTAVARVPDSTGLQAAFVNEAVRSGNEAEALAHLEEVLSEPDPAPSLYALAAALPEAQSDRALEIVREGREVYPEDAALALAEAQVLSTRGDYAGAEKVLAEAQTFAPDNPEVANQLAVAQARQGKTEEASATLERALQENPQGSPVLQRNLAQVYLEAGQVEAAVETLEGLLERTPEDAELYTLYGVALGRAGEFNRALNALDEALRLQPGFAQAERAKRLIEQNRALTGGERVALEPGAEEAFRAGLSALEANDLEAAQRAFDRAFELQETGLIAFYQGYVRQLQGDLRGAVARYERALEDLPESDTVLNNLGFAYFRLGRLDKAVDFLTRATQANPDNGEAQLNLGLIYYDLGRYEDALAPLERALELRPELEGTTVNVGREEPLSFPELMEEVRAQAQ